MIIPALVAPAAWEPATNVAVIVLPPEIDPRVIGWLTASHVTLTLATSPTLIAVDFWMVTVNVDAVMGWTMLALKLYSAAFPVVLSVAEPPVSVRLIDAVVTVVLLNASRFDVTATAATIMEQKQITPKIVSSDDPDIFAPLSFTLSVP